MCASISAALDGELSEFESLQGGAARPSSVAFDNRADAQAIAKRQQQANFQQLLIRRALFESNQIPRHPGFQP